MTEERKHALLGGSNAHRWLKCPASARLEELFPEETSEYAEEGTMAHNVADSKIKTRLDVSDVALQGSDDEMEEATDAYVDYVLDLFLKVKKTTKDAKLLTEVKIDFSKYVPASFGTSDVVIIADGTMYVIDLKYGKGVPVSAYENPQTMLYALGALEEFAFLYDIQDVVMIIHQPRLDNITEFEMSAADLIRWGTGIQGQAELAYSGKGDAVPGEHCQFCKAKAVCQARYANLATVQDKIKDVKLMTTEEIMAVYPHLDQVEKFIKDLKNYMLDQATKGFKWPGLKLVEGRSIRQYSDDLEVSRVLINAGFDEALLYNRKLIGITDMTKLVGNAKFKELLEDSGLVVKPEGKPVLVDETDKREEINVFENLIEEFKEVV